MAERQCKASSAETSYEDCAAGRRRYQTAGFQAEEPHAQAEAAQKATEALGDVGKHQGQAAEDGASEESGDEETSLDSIRDWRAHQVDDKHSDCEGCEVCS